MTAAQPVVCQRPRCGHAYTGHAPGGAHCRRPGCDCAGFRWITPEPAPGGYGAPASPSYRP